MEREGREMKREVQGEECLRDEQIGGEERKGGRREEERKKRVKIRILLTRNDV